MMDGKDLEAAETAALRHAQTLARRFGVQGGAPEVETAPAAAGGATDTQSSTAAAGSAPDRVPAQAPKAAGGKSPKGETNPANGKTTPAKAKTTPATPAAVESAIELPADDAANDGGDNAGVKTGDGEDGAQAQTDAPEPYALEMPEGMTLDEGLLARVTPVARELGLGQEQLQKLAGVYAEHVQAQSEEARAAAETAYRAQQTEWLDELKQDPELGHEAWPESKKLAGHGLVSWFGRDVAEAFELTGLANHPGIVRGLVKLGKLSRERPIDRGGAVSEERELSLEERLWPTTK